MTSLPSSPSSFSPELKSAWVSALRSGHYKQGHHVLANHHTNSFCCLGVLCEVAGLPKTRTNSDYFLYHLDYNDLSISLTLLNNTIAFGLPKDLMSEVMGMNDDGGKSFNEIADYIEDRL